MNRDVITRYNKKRALISIILCAALAVIVFSGITIRLFHTPNAGLGVEGTAIYRMFTVESNMLVGLCAVLCIPYQIDGYRTQNFHMPRWVIYTLYVGVTAVTMTFIIVTIVLSPFAGYKVMLFTSSNFLLHLITPILSVITFIFAVTDHNIRRWGAAVAILPLIIYGTVYVIMVFCIGEANGGWTDVYQLNTYVPWPVVLTAFLCVAILIAQGLRISHNRRHKRQKELTKEMFVQVYGKENSVEEAVRKLAMDNRVEDPGDNDVTVPRRVIRMLEDKYQSHETDSDLGIIYLDEYFKR